MQTAPGVNPHDALYATAQAVLPGGVSSSIRYNKALGRPFYIARGEGAYLYDLEGREYVDLLTSHGATLLGHNHRGSGRPSRRRSAAASSAPSRRPPRAG